MSKSTISTFELFQMFPDAEAARVYMENKISTIKFIRSMDRSIGLKNTKDFVKYCKRRS